MVIKEGRDGAAANEIRDGASGCRNHLVASRTIAHIPNRVEASLPILTASPSAQQESPSWKNDSLAEGKHVTKIEPAVTDGATSLQSFLKADILDQAGALSSMSSSAKEMRTDFEGLGRELEAARVRARIAVSKTNWAAGEKALTEALALRAKFVDCFGENACGSLFGQLHIQRAFCYLKLGALGKALAEADTGIRLDSTSTRGFIIRGRVLMMKERYGDAATAFEAGLKLNPKDSQIIEGLEQAQAFVRRSRPYPVPTPAALNISSYQNRTKESAQSEVPRPSPRRTTGCQMDALFDEFDASGDGVITRQELGRSLRSRGYTDSAVANIHDVLDDDGNGLVTRDELRAAFVASGLTPTLGELLQEVEPCSDVNFSELKRGVLKSGARLPASAGAIIRDHAARGISLPQLRAVYKHAAKHCAIEGWQDFYGKPITPTSFTHYDLCSRVICPATRIHQCSYVELVASGPQRPLWMVVHGWGEPAADFLHSVEQHSSDRALTENAFYYALVYARNFHRSEMNTSSDSSSTTKSFFRHALEGTTGLLCIVDSNASFASRVWPAYEVSIALDMARSDYALDVYTSFKHSYNREGLHERKVLEARHAVGITDGVAAADQGSRFLQLNREKHFPRGLLWMLVTSTVEKGTASMEDDRRFILNTITGRSDIALLPFPKHLAYDAFNSRLRGRFAACALRAAIDGGGDFLKATLHGLKSTRSLDALTVNFAECHVSEVVLQQVIAALPRSLRCLTMTDCAGIMSAEPVIVKLEGLESLSLEGCTCLAHLAAEDALARLESLRHLNVSGCVSLVELPNTIGLARQLNTLLLRDCKALTLLPSSLGVLENLGRLDLRGVASLRALPNLTKSANLKVEGDGNLFEQWIAGGRLAARSAESLPLVLSKPRSRSYYGSKLPWLGRQGAAAVHLPSGKG